MISLGNVKISSYLCGMKNKIGRPKKSKYYIGDYIGQQVNDWKIIGYSHLNNKGEQYWDVECKCGSKSKVRVYPLIKGVSKSCRHCRPQSNSGQLSPWWKSTVEFSISFFNGIKESAKSRNIEFNITPEYIQDLFIKQDRKCVYTGIVLTFPENTRDFSKTASLDRVNSKLGYIEGNVQWIHKIVNKMKMDIDENEFLQFCKLIADGS